MTPQPKKVQGGFRSYNFSHGLKQPGYALGYANSNKGTEMGESRVNMKNGKQAKIQSM